MLQKFSKFQNFQLDNLVYFKKCFKTRFYLQKSASIQPKTNENLRKSTIGCSCDPARPARRRPRPLAPPPSPWRLRRPPRCSLGLAKLANFARFKILQIFGGLVLGCIKTKICKKICVRQHFSSSTRFAYFCTAAIPKF